MVTGLGLAVTLHLMNTDSPSSASLVFASKVTIGPYRTSKIRSCSPTRPKPFSAVQVYFPAKQFPLLGLSSQTPCHSRFFTGNEKKPSILSGELTGILNRNSMNDVIMFGSNEPAVSHPPD